MRRRPLRRVAAALALALLVSLAGFGAGTVARAPRASARAARSAAPLPAADFRAARVLDGALRRLAVERTAARVRLRRARSARAQADQARILADAYGTARRAAAAAGPVPGASLLAVRLARAAAAYRRLARAAERGGHAAYAAAAHDVLRVEAALDRAPTRGGQAR